MPLNRRPLDRSERAWWSRTRHIMLISMAALIVIAFVLPFFAVMTGSQDSSTIAGFPLGYLVAAQVIPALFVGLLIWFIRAQERNDQGSGMAEPEPSAADDVEGGETWA